jgi:hypothetical protein
MISMIVGVKKAFTWLRKIDCGIFLRWLEYRKERIRFQRTMKLNANDAQRKCGKQRLSHDDDRHDWHHFRRA